MNGKLTFKHRRCFYFFLKIKNKRFVKTTKNSYCHLNRNLSCYLFPQSHQDHKEIALWHPCLCGINDNA